MAQRLRPIRRDGSWWSALTGARDSLEAISRMRQEPAMRVERTKAVNIVIDGPGPSG
jgi:hypothetical protein